MDYWHLLLDLPAVVGASSMISLMSPWTMRPRAVPALLFIVGLIVMMLPTLPVVALALMLPAALVQKYLGIELHGHEAADYSPATQKVKGAAQAARDRARKPRLAEITQFVTHAYPAPGDAAELAPAAHAAELDGDADDDEPGDPGNESTASTGARPTADQMTERLAALVADPALPAGARQRLGGGLQRPGLRTGASGVPSYVPAL